MKKIIPFLCLILLLTSCSKTTNEPKELTFEERTLLLIQEAINDYNTSIAADSIIHTINTPQLPIGLDRIEQINSLSELKKREDTSSNAQYIAELNIEPYKMIFYIYGECDSFWQCGEVKFEINTESIYPNNPTMAPAKKILDELLPNSRFLFDNLYGIGVDIDEKESSRYPGYFKVVNSANIENPTSINQIKEVVESVYDKSFISQFYSEIFESESPIYIEDETGLYCIENAPSITDSLTYDTSLIINYTETENEILIDIVSSYDDLIVPDVKRINITKTENGYRLAGLY